MIKITVAIFLLFMWCDAMYAQTNLSKSDMVLPDFKVLAANKAKIKLKDAECMPAYEQLLKDAGRALTYQPVSVMDKTELPPSGDKHDYMSIGPYWWPDSSKPLGIPYTRRDGIVNPEVKNYPDKENLPKLCENIYLLSLAYYFSEDQKYAAHATTLLKVWFLDTATKMNPNLNFGQAVKGITTGRAEGLIDTRHFIFMLNAIHLLDNSKHFTNQNKIGLKQWFSAFLSWMRTSEIGMDEMNAKNNHGVWYDAQRLSMALFTGDKVLAKKIVLSSANRLDKQSDTKGSFPLEMQRTVSLHYTVFVLNAFMVIGQLAEAVDVDFWNLKTASGKSLQLSVEAVIPFLTKQQNWPGKQIKPFKFSDAFPILLKATTKFDCKTCIGGIKNVAGEDYPLLLLNLL